MKIILTFAMVIGSASAQTLVQPVRPVPGANQDYLLGSDDQLKIWALGFEDELKDKTIRVEPSGDIDLPAIGRVKAAGLTTAQLEAELSERMKRVVRQPQVSVEIADYGSQPVSVLGAINQGGIQQLKGRRTLAEVLSSAGGIRPDAGPTIRITREMDMGPIPLSNAVTDPSGRYSTAEVKVADILGARTPAENILIRPHDVIAIAPGDSISVIGAVQKPGPFPMNTRSNVTVLEALAMAGGYGPQPQPQNAKILRLTPGSPDRKEIAVDLRKITAGKSEDVTLRANDILLVPTSMPKRAAVKVGEAALAAAVGFAVWHGF
ncbi:MAG: polysaccharide export protein [Acidobacteriia bacterium]|nr:polysaccharide export protein [Terriglobia bacterium]